MNTDPPISNPDKYKVIFENERVRVLEYTDKPGDKTTLHHHPDTVTFTLSAFERKLYSNGQEKVVVKSAHEAGWQPEQDHVGENIGTTDTHTILVELKEPRPTN
ncbi:MAG: cytoplasmic protein [bacterium]